MSSVKDNYERIIDVRTDDHKTDFEVHPAALGEVVNALFDEGWQRFEVLRTLHGSTRIWVADDSAGDLQGSTCRRLLNAGFEVDLPL